MVDLVPYLQQAHASLRSRGEAGRAPPDAWQSLESSPNGRESSPNGRSMSPVKSPRPAVHDQRSEHSPQELMAGTPRSAPARAYSGAYMMSSSAGGMTETATSPHSGEYHSLILQPGSGTPRTTPARARSLSKSVRLHPGVVGAERHSAQRYIMPQGVVFDI